MVRHYSDTKLFNVSNYEKVYLREKKLQKISIRVKKEVPQRCCSIEDTIAEGPCDKAAEHTKATKKSTGKTDAYREGYRGCQKKSGQGESGKAMTFSQHLRGRCGEGHSPAC